MYYRNNGENSLYVSVIGYSAVDAQLHDSDTRKTRSKCQLVATRWRRLRFRNYLHRALPANRYVAHFLSHLPPGNCAVLHAFRRFGII